MNKKITIGLIVIGVIIILAVIFLMSKNPCNSFELSHAIPTNYCKNIDGNLQYKDCLDTPENKNNIIGISKVLPCNFNKESYFLNDKEVSKTEFFNKINEVNQTCNGCIMIVKPGID